ncbi:MAG: TonB-dependent receptor [Formivibrio sp.]|nr:TonB-dependent receptor [Formivibrio sp.]
MKTALNEFNLPADKAGRNIAFWLKSHHTLSAIKRLPIAPALALVLLASTFIANAHAQVATGDILGTVTDSTGATVASASVTVKNLGTGLSRSLTTASDGEFTFTQLLPGRYEIDISAPSYKTLSIPNIVLSSGDRNRVDGKLTLGEVTETVEVQAAGGGLQTDSSTLSSSINEQATQDLPLNGRNIVNLVQQQVGVNSGVQNGVGAGNRPDDRRPTSSASANGQEELFNLYLLDGLENSDRISGLIGVQPSIDSIEEVRVNTNLYSAELGRTAGAVISIITKAGTNTIHGGAYEFLRNDITDARNYFANPSTITRNPELRQNQFGGSLSGPIAKNKAFFFGDYEGFRQVDATNTVYTSTVPTLFEQNNPGNFTDLPGGIIVTPDPTSLSYFKLYPKPNSGSATATSNNFIYDPARTQQANTYDARVDANLNPNNLLFARFSFNGANTYIPGQFPQVNGVYPGGQIGGTFPGTAKEQAYSSQVNYTHIFNPRILLELRTGFGRLVTNSYALNEGKNLNNTATYSIPGVDSSYLTTGLAVMNIPGYTPLGDDIYLPIQRTQNTFQNNGAVTITKGPHTIKFGAGLTRRQLSLFQSPFGTGMFVWVLGGNATGDMESFVKGGPYVYTRTTQLVTIPLRIWEPSVFAQDDYRVNQKLTVNVGIRYDIFTAPSDPLGNYANPDLSTGQLVVSNTGGVKTRHTNFAPRVGFSASITPKTVLRGGFGLTFFPTDVQQALPLWNPPNTYSTGSVRVTTKLLSAGIPAPVVPSTTTITGALNAKPFNYHTGYSEQFNLNLQRDFGGYVVSIGYVGELGKHLVQQVTNIDLPAPSGNSTVGPLPYAAQFPNVNAIQQFLDEGFSKYHSLQANVDKRVAKGLNFNANYTWAHGLDDLNSGSAFVGSPYGLLPTKLNKYDYGNAAQDIRSRLAMTANYTIPKFNMEHIAGTILNDWKVNGLVFWQTGSAFTVSSSAPQINLGLGDHLKTGHLWSLQNRPLWMA